MKAYETVAITTFADGTQLLADIGQLNPISQTNPIHTVVQGETLLSIAFTYYGNHSDWANIYLANALLDPFTLEVGSKLIIPSN
jgi:nucleoid-associated protein YgaU